MSDFERTVIERLDRLITLLSIAHADALVRVKSELAEDPVASQVLAAAGDWTPSGDIKRVVSKAAGVSEKTVQRVIASLCDRGFLLTEGSGRWTTHKSSGVI